MKTTHGITLTAEQQQAVSQLEGPLLCMAPVGSGKTTVLTHRLLHALDSGYPAETCLCITFTNRAARELQERLRSLHESVRRVPVKTFHGFCAMLLREECEAAGLSSRFMIQDDLDSVGLLEKCRSDNPVERPDARALYYKWSRSLSKLKPERCLLNRIPGEALKSWSGDDRNWLSAYLKQLRESDALDYPLLVYTTRALLNEDKDLRERWAARYRWIQVDEVQDTHLSEWHVLSCLCSAHHNLAFFGDLDQTIYGWRGSEPVELIRAFKAHCGEPQLVSITRNQRGTRKLLELADHIARDLPERHTSIMPAEQLPEGEAPRWLSAVKEDEALQKLLVDMKSRRDTHTGESCAVLARSHAVCRHVAGKLDSADLHPLLEDDLKLGRKPEVRALLALLRLLERPDDRESFLRLLAWSGQSPEQLQALESLRKLKDETRMLPGDLLNTDSALYGDPFHQLLDVWENSHYVVLDVESTGLDPDKDDVIEIACQRWSRNVELDRFHMLLKPAKDLGSSTAVHGITSEQLDREGHEAAEVYPLLREFLGDSLLVGHNLVFDLAILRSHARRCGCSVPDLPFADTLLLARRVLKGGSMRLSDLRERLQLATVPTHRAMDDVSCTAELLHFLLPFYLDSREDRRDQLASTLPLFMDWNRRVRKLRELALVLKPSELTAWICTQHWFKAGFGRQDVGPGMTRLQQWMQRIEQGEAADLSPHRALQILQDNSALAQAVDMLMEEGVPVLTIHAAKGMEFDHVWLAGFSQGLLPDGRSQRGDKLEEERRLAYVAVTRAKRSLCNVSWELDERGRPMGWSEFVQAIAERS